MRLRPFFSYFGAKQRLARHYPAPTYSTIIEPFAGSAGYALRYCARNVFLIDKDPIIAGLWCYLIKVSESEIRGLPITFDCVDSLSVAQEAKWLIGFWCGRAKMAPSRAPGKWMRTGNYPTHFWGDSVRNMIADQLRAIRHWRAFEGAYHVAPDVKVTWFIDPPYSDMDSVISTGSKYRYGSEALDYRQLSQWCQSRPGQVIVCENAGANWLPFRRFASITGMQRKSVEAIWCRDG